MYNKSLLKASWRLAHKWHKGQYRKWGGEKYITHPIAVAEKAGKMAEQLKFSEIRIITIKCAAILHDTIEDNFKVKDDVLLDIIV